MPVESTERVAETVVKEPEFPEVETNPVRSKPLLTAPIPETLGRPLALEPVAPNSSSPVVAPSKAPAVLMRVDSGSPGLV